MAASYSKAEPQALRRGYISYLSLHEYRRRDVSEIEVTSKSSRALRKTLGLSKSKEMYEFEEMRPLKLGLGAPSPPLTPDLVLHNGCQWQQNRPWPLTDISTHSPDFTSTASTYHQPLTTVGTLPLSPLESATTNFLAKYSPGPLSSPRDIVKSEQDTSSTFHRDTRPRDSLLTARAPLFDAFRAGSLANTHHPPSTSTTANTKFKARKRLPHPNSLRLHQPPQTSQQSFNGSTYKLAISPFAWSGSDLSANINTSEEASSERAHRFTRLLSDLQLDVEDKLEIGQSLNKGSISEDHLFNSHFITPPPTPPTIDLDQFYSGNAYSRDTLQSYHSIPPSSVSKSLYDIVPSEPQRLHNRSSDSLWESVSERASCEDQSDSGEEASEEMEGSNDGSQNGRSRRLWDDADTARLSIMRRRRHNSQSGHTPLTDHTFEPVTQGTVNASDDGARTTSAPPTFGPTPPHLITPISPVLENPFMDANVVDGSPEYRPVVDPSPKPRPSTPSVIRTLGHRLSQMMRSSSPSPHRPDPSVPQGEFEYGSRVSRVSLAAPRLDSLDFSQSTVQSPGSYASNPEDTALERLRVQAEHDVVVGESDIWLDTSIFEDAAADQYLFGDNALDEYEYEDMSEDLLDAVNSLGNWTDEEDVVHHHDNGREWTDEEDADSQYSKILDIVGGYEPTAPVVQASHRRAQSSVSSPPSCLPPLPPTPSQASGPLPPMSGLDWTPDGTTQVLLRPDVYDPSIEVGRRGREQTSVQNEPAGSISPLSGSVSDTQTSASPVSPARSHRGIPTIWQQRSASPLRSSPSPNRHRRQPELGSLSAIAHLDLRAGASVPASSSWITMEEGPSQVHFSNSLRRETRDVRQRSRYMPAASSLSLYTAADPDIYTPAPALFPPSPVRPQPALTRTAPAYLFGSTTEAGQQLSNWTVNSDKAKSATSPGSLLRTATARGPSPFDIREVPLLSRGDFGHFEDIELTEVSSGKGQKTEPLSPSPVYPQRRPSGPPLFASSDSLDTSWGPASSHFDLRSMPSTLPLTQSILPIKNGVYAGAFDYPGMFGRCGTTPYSAHLHQNTYHALEKQKAMKRAKRAVIGLCVVSALLPPMYLVLWCGGLDCFLSIVTRRKVDKMPVQWRRNVGWCGLAVVVLWFVVAGLSMITLARH